MSEAKYRTTLPELTEEERLAFNQLKTPHKGLIRHADGDCECAVWPYNNKCHYFGGKTYMEAINKAKEWEENNRIRTKYTNVKWSTL